MISKKSIEYLLNTLQYFGEQFDDIADTCFEDVKNALLEIKDDCLPQNTLIVPFGSYLTKSNYQIVEPMEFYVVLKGDREVVLAKEYKQKQESLKFKKQKKSNESSVKSIYQNILGGSSKQEEIYTCFDVAKIIMDKMQKYLGEDDIVYFKNNVVFVKFKTQDDIQILTTITVVYDFDNNNYYEFKKYGISTKENCNKMIKNIFDKNMQTNGNYLVLCKLIKMLELELIITNMSTKYLSKKSLFVEHILYNIPNVLYLNDDYCQVFVNIANYIKHCNPNTLLLADNTTKMFPEHGYYAKSDLQSFVKKLIYLTKNTDTMIEEAIKNYTENTNENSQDNQDLENQQNSKNVKKLGK